MRDNSASDSAATMQVTAATITGAEFMLAVRTGAAGGAFGGHDPTLPHWSRVLVPVDVQAYVAPPGGGEDVVPMTGGPSDRGIASFAPGAPLAAGVHLHWAMPDALLAAPRVSRADGAVAPTLRLPALPDLWVVVRTLQSVGVRTVTNRAWVVDAANASVLDLAAYAGASAPSPAAQARMSPLDGASGGSLHWTSSYAASAGRFTFHDTLADLAGSDGTVPTGRWHADQATYTVAGWWGNVEQDPLTAFGGPLLRNDRLAALGWFDGADASDGPEEFDSPAGSGPGSTRSRIATLVHGSVFGVPVAGALPPDDDRPAASKLGVGIGHDLDDVVAALGADVLRLGPGYRASAEHLVAAFTGGLIERLGSVDGLEDLAEHEHADTFWALPGTPVDGAQPDRLRATDSELVGPTTAGRKGRAAQLGVGLEWSRGGDPGAPASAHTGFPPDPPPGKPRPAHVEYYDAPPRVQGRPAPRFFRPQAPMVALRGARPSHRHHGDGDYEEDGRLRVRYPADCVSEYTGVIKGADVLATLGNLAVPEEVLLLVREAVLLNPYGWEWLAAAANPAAGSLTNVSARLEAEMVRLYGVDGRYDGTSHLSTMVSGSVWADVSAHRSTTDRQAAAELAKHSLLRGTPPSPVAVTTWRQPWVPLWLEWRVHVQGLDSADGWELDGVDLRPVAPAGNPVSRTIAGLSPVNRGATTTLHYAISRWLEAERQRAASANPELPAADTDLLDRLGDLLGVDSGTGVDLDLVSASLDGIREQLLGIDYVGSVVRAAGANPPAPGQPVPLFAGVLRLEELRLVDAFGRILAVPPAAVAATATTTDLTVAATATTTNLTVAPPPGGSAAHPGMLMRPRIQHHARWLLRLVSPVPGAGAPAEAFIDQIQPDNAVNPVSGFLLPDHMDEELEAFTVDGKAIGELGHDAISATVTWEPAPGRPLPPDAPPVAGIEPAAGIVAEIVSGLLRADAQARALAVPPAGSALSALLRAIDTTLWSVDTFGAIGSATVAGLIGRPVAVVRALLTLDAANDLSEVDVQPPATVADRAAAFAGLAERRFAVRLGAATRSDDALLGFYVDDDYTRLRLVDKAIAEYAVESGRYRGHLGRLGAVKVPVIDPLAHPYVVPEPTLWVRPGQTVRLTLLMLPAGRVHLTSGILPRKQLALAEDWVASGLRRLVPSVRVGPVLVDPAEIRLPLVSVLGERQTFTRRTGPLTWRDDPIVAASQSAYLPRLPHEAQEGWVRVTPEEPEARP